MIKCLEHHRITFNFLIIRALLVFFLLLACPCPHHNLLLKCHEQFSVVIQHPTLQLMHKSRDQIKSQITLLSQYHERKSTGGESLLCKLSSMTVWMTNIEYICNTNILYIEIVMRIVSKAGSVMINTSPSPQR